LTISYPEAAKKVFEVVSAQNMLQIWSDDDKVAKPDSSRRFIENMSSCKVGGTHLEIPKDRPAINKTIDFLYKSEIERAKELSTLPYIIIDKPSGLPGDKICIASPYYGEYGKGCSISVKLGNNPVESKLEGGKCIFEVPDKISGIKVVKAIFSDIPNHPDIESDPVYLIVQPHLRVCSPCRVLIGVKTVIYGEYPLNNEISVYLDGSEVSYEFSENNNGSEITAPEGILDLLRGRGHSPGCEITVPEGISDGKKEIKIRYNGVYSNPIELIACDLVGNYRTKELHLKECPWVGLMNSGNKVFLSSTYDNPRENGFYDSCHWCHVRNPEKMGPSERNA